MIKLDYIREKLMDYWMLLSSISAIVGGLLMIIYCASILAITILKPYVLFLALICLGFWGLKYYFKEVEI
jgi:hypothetical protein